MNLAAAISSIESPPWFDIARATDRLMRAIVKGASLDQLHSELQCGTSCGSCVPELRRMLLTTAKFNTRSPILKEAA